MKTKISYHVYNDLLSKSIYNKKKTKTRVYVFITLHILYPINLHEDIHTSVFENYTLSLFLSFRKKNSFALVFQNLKTFNIGMSCTYFFKNTFYHSFGIFFIFWTYNIELKWTFYLRGTIIFFLIVHRTFCCCSGYSFHHHRGCGRGVCDCVASPPSGVFAC